MFIRRLSSSVRKSVYVARYMYNWKNTNISELRNPVPPAEHLAPFLSIPLNLCWDQQPLRVYCLGCEENMLTILQPMIRQFFRRSLIRFSEFLCSI